MFRHHAGEDPIDQLNFMADQGFTAFEDNDMRKREVALQEKMAATMEKRGLRMGVFVAHEIYWQKPNLASGDAKLTSGVFGVHQKSHPRGQTRQCEMDDCSSGTCGFKTEYGLSNGARSGKFKTSFRFAGATRACHGFGTSKF